MTRTDVEKVVENLILIRGNYRSTMSRWELDELAKACNLIDHSSEVIAKIETVRDRNDRDPAADGDHS